MEVPLPTGGQPQSATQKAPGPPTQPGLGPPHGKEKPVGGCDHLCSNKPPRQPPRAPQNAGIATPPLSYRAGGLEAA